MWHASNIYSHRGWNVPQFYGKWPFIKVWGLQEPASVLFSFLNWLANVYNIIQFRKVVPSSAPLYLLCHSHFLICANAWIWSMVFHARDTLLSEKLDYFSAFSMVLFSLLMLLIRTRGRGNLQRKVYLFGGAVLFFLYHVWYLSTRRFDYGYNMKVNVTIGVLNGVEWMWWTVNRPDYHPYLFWCRVTMVCMGATMFLELLDFPPLFWTFDAHALWHLATSVLPFLWYRFLEGDCLYLLENSSRNSKLKKSV
ncbi:UNVERIFIED_CONTAM: hypothetical protein GTU68_006431 [Idotea baltica]|nr:hypothetical protein [Idotea baltica]